MLCSWLLAEPPRLVSEIWGTHCALATPMRAFAAIRVASAALQKPGPHAGRHLLRMRLAGHVEAAMNVFGIVPEKNADGVFLDRDLPPQLR
jgi:hypothetical protein